VGVVDLTTGQHVAHLEFKAGVDEIFDVQVLPGARLPALSGPVPARDAMPMIWIVPDPRGGGPSTTPGDEAFARSAPPPVQE
jgi:hypothetical protein